MNAPVGGIIKSDLEGSEQGGDRNDHTAAEA
jgi:hypothetical protein